jgi:16S rRNA (guanine527-N7)-methyltransferase
MNKTLLFFKEKTLKFNIELDDSQLEQFKIYWQILDEYNKHTNIVSSTEITTVFERHFLDSLAIGLLGSPQVSLRATNGSAVPARRRGYEPYGAGCSESAIQKNEAFFFGLLRRVAPRNDGGMLEGLEALKESLTPRNDGELNFAKIIDIGIGGGFPGIPILIAFPGARLCGVDSVGKKIKFLETLSVELGIQDRVEFLNTRAEELGRNKAYRDNFDIALTRAVGSMNLISEYCLPFVKPGGYFVAYKSKNAEKEIIEAKHALGKLNAKFITKVSCEISVTEKIERNLLLIEKIGKTPDQFPRKTGIPAKSPL